MLVYCQLCSHVPYNADDIMAYVQALHCDVIIACDHQSVCIAGDQDRRTTDSTALVTHGDLFFIQVCSAATPMHCSTGQGKMRSVLISAALQKRLTGSMSLQLHL